MASNGAPNELERLGGTDPLGTVDNVQLMPLSAEQIVVTKRVRKTRVRVARSTRTRETLVEEDLAHDQVVVDRVPVGRVVDAMPEV